MKYSVIFVMAILFTGCQSMQSKDLPSNFSIKEFKQWPVPKQAKFIDSLNSKAQIKFLAELLPESTFNVPPYEYVKFFADGEIIFDWDLDSGGQAGGDPGAKNYKYFIGHWKSDGEKIVIEKSDEQVPVFKDGDEWSGIKKIGNITKDEMLTIEITGKYGTTLSYYKDNEMVTPAIEAYSALKSKKQ